MSFAVPIVSSKVPPVEEFAVDGENALLAEFRSPHHIALKIEEQLDNQDRGREMGKRARETILERTELNKCLRKQEDLMYSIVR